METKVIKLRDGSDLEVNISDKEFYRKIREAFEISTDEPVTDDHIKMFFYGALKGAVEKEVKGNGKN
tara:strand:+ start:2025 stop:2225 length:201 start_codon:yes stop_codon:yes gene_type:complete